MSQRVPEQGPEQVHLVTLRTEVEIGPIVGRHRLVVKAQARHRVAILCDTSHVRLVGKSGLTAEAVPQSDRQFAANTCWVETTVTPGGGTPVTFV